MFVIGATKKLQNELKSPVRDLNEYQDVPDLYKWHANMITVKGRKCLMLMNNETGINLTLFGLQKEQFEHLDNVIKGSLQQLFQLLDVDKKAAYYILDATDEIVYTKTDNRSVMGMMNETKARIDHTVRDLSYEEIDAVALNKDNNVFPMSPLKHLDPVTTLNKYFEE
ncbi:hypothetical protein JF544_13040 [Halobacillus kuroshimensis]|uniref:DUF6933 domain-containing protein n=1 Tax=Halobacillus kuroshimensis TaxID=302481 RepID=A0ABS3DYA5_9BACI|nr:hypothetical protein [Halobacillus kuroshimensis]MBN8236184.1 hypothetical protein [Halobacillus kuroshimensis]